MILFLILSQVFPEPYGFVNDYAKVLNSNQKNELENYLRNIEEKTSVEIAVAIFDSIGYPIEEYANLLFEKWGIGKKGKDNGILILVSMKERLIRIEVGYGLEEVITDGIAGEIIRNNIIPYFKEGNYYIGLKSAILEIEKRISKENQNNDKNNEESGILYFILFFEFVFGLFFGLFLSYAGLVFGIIFLFYCLVLRETFLFLFPIGVITGSIISSFKFKYNYITNGNSGILTSRGFGGGLSGGGRTGGGFGGGLSDGGRTGGGFGGGLSGGGGATGRW